MHPDEGEKAASGATFSPLAVATRERRLEVGRPRRAVRYEAPRRYPTVGCLPHEALPPETARDSGDEKRSR
jgi:hypothetical protein